MTNDDERPLIPKRLAARIRGAQERVSQKRWSIVAAEFNAAQAAERIAEFERDPEGFAERNYGGNGVDSYPVQKNIETNRERVAYHEHRKHERLCELTELEDTLQRVEEEVLANVNAMRPSAGREAWPQRLPSLEQYREQHLVEMEQLARESREERAKDDAEFERMLVEEERLREEEERKQEG